MNSLHSFYTLLHFPTIKLSVCENVLFLESAQIVSTLTNEENNIPYSTNRIDPQGVYDARLNLVNINYFNQINDPLIGSNGFMEAGFKCAECTVYLISCNFFIL